MKLADHPGSVAGALTTLTCGFGTLHETAIDPQSDFDLL
jgi:hypothetical protein